MSTQRNIRQAAEKEVAARAERLKAQIAQGTLERDTAIEQLVQYSYAVATKYGITAATVAAEMYDAATQLLGLNLPPAIPADTAGVGEVAKAVNATFGSPSSTTGAAVGRYVKRAGADTTIKNAIRDGAEWAWVPIGDTCPFCLTLASRGWQKASEKVLKGGHAEHIHSNCDCNFAVRHNGRGGVEGYDPQTYLDMYEAAEGSTPEDKINAMRRSHYAENKDKINAQKRAAYALRVEKKENGGQ